MSGPTPGPWYVAQHFIGEDFAVVSSAVVDEDGDDQAVVETVANKADAYLIAAAPDLLEACRAAQREHLPISGPPTALLVQLDAAIALAEGKS